MSNHENTPNGKGIIPNQYDKFERHKQPAPYNLFNRPERWLVEKLLQGHGIKHDDCINAGYWHRLAINVKDLRYKLHWKGIIITNRSTYKYFINKHRMDDAVKLAKDQFGIHFRGRNND